MEEKVTLVGMFEWGTTTPIRFRRNAWKLATLEDLLQKLMQRVNEILLPLSRLFTCLVDVVGIYIKINKEKNKTKQKASIPFRARFDESLIITSYLVNGLSLFPVVLEGNSIVTVLQFVLCNPLVDLIPSL